MLMSEEQLDKLFQMVDALSDDEVDDILSQEDGDASIVWDEDLEEWILEDF